MVDELLAEILSGPLDEVVAARDGVVRRLRREKRGEEAAELARLRRPSPPLWAVNRLHDLDPDGLRELFDAGEGVRAGQAALLGGEADAARRMSHAGDRLSGAVTALTRAAMHVLVDQGHGAGVDAERRLRSMLRAVATGEEPARIALMAGRLVAEPQPAGFDLLAGVPMSPRAGDEEDLADTPPPERGLLSGSTSPPGEHAHAAAAVADRERRMELERAVAQRRDAAERAERDVAERRGHIAALQVEAGELRRRLETLSEQIAAERTAAESAEAAALGAQAAVERAQAALGAAGIQPPPAAPVKRRRR